MKSKGPNDKPFYQEARARWESAPLFLVYPTICMLKVDTAMEIPGTSLRYKIGLLLTEQACVDPPYTRI